MEYIKGSCECGKITFKVKDKIESSQHCHCLECQRLHGSAFVTWVGFKTSDYKIIDPSKLLKMYKMNRSDRGFCSHCGSTFYFKYNKKHLLHEESEAVFFTMANILSPVKFEPTEHIYYSSHGKWINNIGQLPKREN